MSGAGAGRLLIDPAAVAANVARLRGPRRTPLMAVVKADGFGLGARALARAALAGGASRLATATVAEAYEVADLGVPVLAWLMSPDELADQRARLLGSSAIEVAVGSPEHLAAALGRCRPGADAVSRPLRIHLFADCGMSRDGCPDYDWATLCEQVREAERAGLVRCVGLMGHLACGEHVEEPCHRGGTATFDRAVEVAGAHGLRPGLRHLAATSAALGAPGTHHTLLRTGAGLVGIDPAGLGRLQPAARLEAPLAQVRRVPAGASVGYGHHHHIERDTWLGLLPLGYADGIPRSASSRAQVTVDGVRRDLLGLVSMDQCVVDLGERMVPAGTVATVFGPHGPSLAEWAAWSGLLEHEVLTGIGRRVRRLTQPVGATEQVA